MCLSRSGRAQHQRLQARVQHERRDRVHELCLEQLDRRDLVEEQTPRVPLAQVDLLQVLVEPALGEQILRAEIVGQQRDLRQLGRRGDPVRRRQHLRPAYAVERAEQPAHVAVRNRLLGLEHVPVEAGRAPHRLAGVADDEVEAVA